MRKGQLVTLSVVVFAVPTLVLGQTGAPDGWTVPRTVEGNPDLQGIWASDSATPLERPEELLDKATLTDEEVATLQARAASLFDGDTDAAFGESVFRAALTDQQDFRSGDGVTETTPDGTGNYNQFWLIDRWFDNRTSLIVDPSNGRLPSRTPEAEARIADTRAARENPSSVTLTNELATLGSGLRCRGGRVPLTGRGYNSNYQIFQTADHVAIQMEMMHDTRLIPIGGEPPHPSSPRADLGSSHGYWEGDTLVVETTNLARGSSGSTRDLHLTERFTRVGPDTLQYEYTMDDPSTWTQPWTARVFMRPAPGTGVIYEFACHEGNYAIEHALRGARALEATQGAEQ
ncbi:MAG: hypothetical protein VYE68_00815 [Acidobacteriota bacterium]|nr:hypothetical protein [Acidobacteriota bacterium]